MKVDETREPAQVGMAAMLFGFMNDHVHGYYKFKTFANMDYLRPSLFSREVNLLMKQ